MAAAGRRWWRRGCPRAYYLAARPLRPLLGAGREVERGRRPAGVELAVVGDGADAWRPLAAPAALAYRPARRRRGRSMAVRVWPLAALARLPRAGRARSRTTRSRGWRCRSAILAVQGVAVGLAAPARRSIVAAALALMTVPGFAHKLAGLDRTRSTSAGDPFFVFPGRGARRCKALEADPRPAACSAPSYAGYMIPYTHRPRDVHRRAALDAGLEAARVKLEDGLVRGHAARRGGAQVRALHQRALRSSWTAGRAWPTSSRSCARCWPTSSGSAARRSTCCGFRPEMARVAGPPDA